MEKQTSGARRKQHNKNRKAGVLLPVFSLPGKYGIGSFGKEARAFLDGIAAQGFTVWQVLPLTPTGYGDSPYQSECGYAGNPYFIDLETLHQDGLLTKKELASAKAPQAQTRVDYGELYRTRLPLLRKAYARFTPDEDYLALKKDREMATYALFSAIKYLSGGKCWQDWEEGLRLKKRGAIACFQKEHADEIGFRLFLQYEFRRQWSALKSYANALGVEIFGDMPLYVSYDSVEVWSSPELFQLDEERRPTLVAGVPPDYFSENGQLWGNPVYDYAAQKKDGYRFWKRRIRCGLTLFDRLRIDHFRGLDRFYAVPAGAETARNGAWYDGPKEELFRGFRRAPLVAEDLGTTDDSLKRFLKNVGYPGMRVLSFMFDGNPENPHLPANYVKNAVAYTGTHDNPPLFSLLQGQNAEAKAGMFRILGEECRALGLPFSTKTDRGFLEKSIEAVLFSPANLAIIPFFDLLRQGEEARVNTPGDASGKNWTVLLTDQNLQKLCRLPVKELIENSGRA